ncbi:MAG: Gfo/Idh/MocA family oxidoreductase, partial [Bacteroidales bacterium]|nr:Gfo/Idh/MocA family oxidoreductase [Bacteroidales bacterium]
MKRRDFLHKSAALAAGTGIVSSFPGTAKAAVRILGANERVNIGAIGLKGMGMSDLKSFLRMEGVECLALCDVDRNILEQRAAEVEEIQGKKAKLYGDYRQLLEHKDLDAVIIGTPDHWHTLPMIEACQAGLDVYVEKPIAN